MQSDLKWSKNPDLKQRQYYVQQTKLYMYNILYNTIMYNCVLTCTMDFTTRIIIIILYMMMVPQIRSSKQDLH